MLVGNITYIGWVSMKEKYILTLGNPLHGFEFVGPFDSAYKARDYAINDRNLSQCGDWWVMLLQAPALEGDDA